MVGHRWSLLAERVCFSFLGTFKIYTLTNGAWAVPSQVLVVWAITHEPQTFPTSTLPHCLLIDIEFLRNGSAED
jgi:hypothetical protein